MDRTAHLAALRTEAATLLDAAERAGWEGGVPSCPDWSVRDLVVHLGGVHRWAAAIVGEGRTERPSAEERAAFGAAPGDDGIGDWFRHGVDGVATAIDDADPLARCFTLFPAGSGRDFWARRMAHETFVHRVDAQLAAGDPVASAPPELVLDGIAELVEEFLPVRAPGLVTDPPRVVEVEITGASAGRWSVTVGPEGPTATAGAAHGADVRLVGPAAALHLVLWNRIGHGSVRVEGDRRVLDLWRERARI